MLERFIKRIETIDPLWFAIIAGGLLVATALAYPSRKSVAAPTETPTAKPEAVDAAPADAVPPAAPTIEPPASPPAGE